MRVDEIPSRMPDHEAASAAVSAAFSILPFPISKEMAIEAVGGWRIRHEGREVPLGRMIDLLPEEEFEDPMAAVRAVDLHWGDIRRMLDRGGRRGASARGDEDGEEKKDARGSSGRRAQ